MGCMTVGLGDSLALRIDQNGYGEEQVVASSVSTGNHYHNQPGWRGRVRATLYPLSRTIARQVYLGRRKKQGALGTYKIIEPGRK